MDYQSFLLKRDALIRKSKFLTILLTNKNGQVVIVQWPNLPLIGWAVARTISTVSTGKISTGFSLAATILLFVWAVMEIGWGDSLLRRLLGLGIGLPVLYSIIRIFLKH